MFLLGVVRPLASELVTGSNQFQLLRGPKCRVDSVLVLGLPVDPIANPCVVRLAPDEFVGQSCSFDHNRASFLYDSSYRSKAALYLGIRS